MEDHKRKSQAGTATEENKKARVESHSKHTEPASITIPNDGDALLLKLAHSRAMSIKTRDEIIFSAQRDDNLCKVFKGLCDKKFLSVPVFTQGDRKKWLSFIDIFDIVKYVNHHFGKEKMSPEHDFWKLSQESEQFQGLRVDDVMSFPTKENKFHPITQDYSLLSVVEIMARDQHAHHIPILNNMKERHLVSILTMSQMVKYVHDNLQYLGTKKDLLVSEMRGLCNDGDIVTVPTTMITIDAFKLMEEKNISGLAVVDDKGVLVDTLSTRDLKAMATDGSLFWKLYRPVSAFLDFIKKDANTIRPRHAIFALKTDTFESVLNKIFTNEVHRIFIVDHADTKKPIGVVSLGDLLLQILPI
ncbi:hypothetical protein SAMD00019534_061690 [Acytostelium subglobosum LB1]|uniref:hypothetical protein n=1 Tax=Acytostelium subglobosum LB1 TaxID=1410327 RepID=UPI0006449CF8|nr:hypothetical protein SAMD00019534_061690 [Acytostelium subglobosum LB1]GAM22994.1 hypothetical protein SAMD00019534_061690 [Acytostelium subglobosum LB1]|eukprot:XP_012754221.1 hypothetical protein SAMD00019534_061690 [Acytostelium subglobosum LB1]